MSSVIVRVGLVLAGTVTELDHGGDERRRMKVG